MSMFSCDVPCRARMLGDWHLATRLDHPTSVPASSRDPVATETLTHLTVAIVYHVWTEFVVKTGPHVGRAVWRCSRTTFGLLFQPDFKLAGWDFVARL
jgi:hypothetical protein